MAYPLRCDLSQTYLAAPSGLSFPSRFSIKTTTQYPFQPSKAPPQNLLCLLFQSNVKSEVANDDTLRLCLKVVITQPLQSPTVNVQREATI
jgi:hypothetical protein